MNTLCKNFDLESGRYYPRSWLLSSDLSFVALAGCSLAPLMQWLYFALHVAEWQSEKANISL
jgi:hypothetical protein